jgi:hypothetical protein
MRDGSTTYLVGPQIGGPSGVHNATEFSADTYDALKPNGKRRSPSAVIAREDVGLRAKKRIQLTANARDLARNFAIAAWMIRRHLDYVAQFNFSVKTGDRGLNAAIADYLVGRSNRAAMDRGGRLNREKFFRLAEMRRCLDGDCGLLRLRSGQTQFIEGDLIRTGDGAPQKPKGGEWEEGVRIDSAGLPLEFSISRRGTGGRGYQWQRNVPSQNFYLYGFFDRDAANQVRGVTPITTGLNTFRDVYENIDYAQMRSKISQLFVAAFKRKSSAASLETVLPTVSQNDVEAQDAAAADEPEPRVLDLSKGPTVFDLDEDEDLAFITPEDPSSEFQSFMQVAIAIALKSLDIPYSFYDEAYTNYSGSRGSWLLYDRACTDKRNDQIEMRREWTKWQLFHGVVNGELVLPRRLTVDQIRVDWIPRGMPWWKPSEEVVGTLKAIGGGLDNPIRACQEADRGDVFENIDATISVMKYAREQGIAELGEPLQLSFEAEFPTVINEAPKNE